MGLNTEQSSGVLLALQQMISKGTVQAEELRGQLGERLPGAFQIAAKAMGVTTAELGKMLEQGQVIADDFLPKFARALNENIGNAAEQAADRLDAATNRFSNAWERVKQSIGDAGISSFLKGELNALTDDLSVFSETMKKVEKSGGGFLAQVSAATAVEAGRAGFAILNGSANLLNGTINLLTGNVFGLNTNLALLPDILKTDAQQAAALERDLANAESKFADLKAQGAEKSESFWTRNEIYELGQYIEKLKAAQAERAKLQAGNTDSQAGDSIRTQRAADEAKRLEGIKNAMQKVMQDLSGVKESFQKDLNALYAGYTNGLLSLSQYQAQVAKLINESGGGKVFASATKEANKQLEEQRKLLDELSGLTSNYTEDLGRLVAARKSGVLNEQQYVQAVTALIAKQPFAIKLEKEQADAAKQVADAMARGNDLYLKKIESIDQSTDSIAKQVQKLRDEEEALGVAAAQNISLAKAIELVIIKRLEEQRAQALLANDTGTADALQREIEKRRELAKEIGSKDIRDASKKAAEETARDWQRVSDQIGQGLTDSLFRAFEAGRGFFDTLWKGIANTFKTTTLKLIIQGVDGKSGIVGSALNYIGVPGYSSGASAGAGGGLGGLGNLGSLFGLGSGTGAFGSAFSGGTILGSDAIGAGFTALTSGSGTLAGNLGQILGGVNGSLSAIGGLGGALGYGSALVSLSQGKYGAAAGAGLGTFFGGPVGAALGSAIGGAIDKAFGSVGAKQSGASYLSNGTTGQAVNGGMFGLDRAWGDSIGKYFSQGVQDALKTSTTVGAGLLNSVSTAFGGMGGYQVGAFFASDNTRASQGNRSVLGPNGQILSSWSGSGLDKDPTKGLEQLTTALAGDVRTALEQIDIPSWAKSQLQSLTGDVSFEQLSNVVQNILATKDAFLSLGQAMPQLTDLTDSAVEGLLKAFNGIDNLKTAASSYYENFYSDAEKSARATQQLTEQLSAVGVVLPKTRDAYRALVEAQDLNTESGQKAYATLLQLSPAFAALVPAVQQAAQAVDQAAAQMAEAGRRALASLAEQTGSLQVDLLNAQGRTLEAAALERQQALAKITEGLSAQDAAAATAAYDLNAALKQQIQATNDAASAAQQAAAAQQQAAAAFNASLSGLADTRFSLENQLLTLNGDTASVAARTREKELARLTEGLSKEDAAKITAAYDLNASLQAQIDATKAAQQQAQEYAAAQQRAADEAAKAAQQIADAWTSAGKTLLEEVDRIRNQISGDSSTSFAQAQSKFAITLAQAQAGSLDATKLLPGLSQSLLSIAEQQSVSFADLQSLRARTAASLEALAGTLGLTPSSSLNSASPSAVSYTATPLQPSTFTAQAQGAQDDLLTELKGLREEVIALRKQVDVSNSNTGRAAEALEGNQSVPILVEMA